MISPSHKRVFAFFLLLIALLVLVIWRRPWDGPTKSHHPKRHLIEGQTMGTIHYRVQYIANVSDTTQLIDQSQVDNLLNLVDRTFSTYRSDAEIMCFNKEGVLHFPSTHWLRVLALSKEVYEQSRGAFDPTLGPIIEAWGFGASGSPSSDTAHVDEILGFVGFDQLEISEEVIRKSDPRQLLDLSAVAKGYAVDLLAERLEELDIQDYMIEIGGEVRVSGHRKSDQYWRIGIQDPRFASENRAAAVVALPYGGVATSGNYRNFRQVSGHRYGHTINPRTGRPEDSSLRSATVWAKSTAHADALATACLVLGLSESRALILGSSEVEAIFFYTDSLGRMLSYLSDGIRPYVSSLSYDTLLPSL